MKGFIEKILAKIRVSRLAWHDLRSVSPISRKFGLDRGTPIDRYYIEKFLFANRSHITGCVLEVAESKYSKRMGSKVTSYEVLHVEKNKAATIVGDLTKSNSLPNNKIDCFICTQVLNFIFDFQSAIQGIYHLLKQDGIALVTVSGISQISHYDATRWGHFWSFYPQGIERSFKQVFGEENVHVSVFGNSLSAISFLKGIAKEELTSEELDFNDPDYPVTIAILVKKT